MYRSHDLPCLPLPLPKYIFVTTSRQKKLLCKWEFSLLRVVWVQHPACPNDILIWDNLKGIIVLVGMLHDLPKRGLAIGEEGLNLQTIPFIWILFGKVADFWEFGPFQFCKS